MQEKLHRLPAVRETTGLSKASIYELIAKGKFPRPIRIGERAVGWRESDLMTWIATREKAA